MNTLLRKEYWSEKTRILQMQKQWLGQNTEVKRQEITMQKQ